MRTLAFTGDHRVLDNFQFIQPARALFDRFGALATLVKAVADLNRSVHMETYTRLIAAQ